MIYYQALKKARNPDFPAPIVKEPERLQSRDADFTHVWKGDYFDALPEFVVQPDGAAAYLEIEGIRLGFAQAPDGIIPEEAFQKSRKLKTKLGTQFSILDPLRLYRNKQYLVTKNRGKANDTFHLEIARTYAVFELTQAIRRNSSNPTSRYQ